MTSYFVVPRTPLLTNISLLLFILHISILSKILTKKVQSNLTDILYIGHCYVLGIVLGARKANMKIQHLPPKRLWLSEKTDRKTGTSTFC